MIRVAVTNPNTTASMTEGIARAARAAAAPDVEILAGQSAQGPEAIEGPFDGALAVPGMLAQMRRAELEGAGAHVIACFDDTGLDAARACLSAPVVGIGEAGMHIAALLAHRFAVVTTLSRSVPVISDNVRRYGFAERCSAVLASDIPVLALHDPATGAGDVISQHIEQALKQGAEAIVLGCAGMTDFARALEQRHGVPVIEGVGAAVGLASQLARQGAQTSRIGVWARPTRLSLLD
ncbi:aspartate/glutamate racemase family protein [Celeribacter sp.]|uniref:aspartate/glutamate racemase family protein n=1 Tax=Celeribacter sp. TaxID=1890673 RepID=UPI003A8C9E25